MDESKLYRTAEATALRFLLSRPRSRREVEERLREKGYGDTVITRVVERLQQLDYINDTEFARRWLESEINRKPQGRIVLRQKLLERGISSDEAGHVLAAAFDRTAEIESARTAARKKLPLLAKGDREKRRGRLGQYLQRRGFDYGVIVQVLGELFNPDD